jgi:GDSL-like Lipase/Acylhydrolase family
MRPTLIIAALIAASPALAARCPQGQFYRVLIAADFLDPAARRAVIDRTCETLKDLSRRAAERGIPVLIATFAPPSSPDILRLPVWRESVRDSVAEVNQWLRRYGSQSGVGVVDFSAALGAGDRLTPEKFRADTLHLNPLGYDRLASALYRALDGLENRLQKPTNSEVHSLPILQPDRAVEVRAAAADQAAADPS